MVLSRVLRSELYEGAQNFLSEKKFGSSDKVEETGRFWKIWRGLGRS